MARFEKKRQRNKKIEPKKVYIFCEGKTTEPLYFEGFKKEIEERTKKKKVDIIIDGTGRNTISLINYIILEIGRPNKNEGLPQID